MDAVEIVVDHFAAALVIALALVCVSQLTEVCRSNNLEEFPRRDWHHFRVLLQWTCEHRLVAVDAQQTEDFREVAL